MLSLHRISITTHSRGITMVKEVGPFQFTQVHLRVKKSSTAYRLKIEPKTSKILTSAGEREHGVKWCIENYSFNSHIMLKDKPCTKRGILSTITSIFGTLGFVAPIILEGNKILRELCKENTCWDEPVSDAIKAKSGLDISARPLTQASVKSVGECKSQITRPFGECDFSSPRN